MWARIYLTPLLQAEEDRDQVRRYWADQAREKELLGENLKVYNSDRYVLLLPSLFSPRGSSRWEGPGSNILWQVREADVRGGAPGDQGIEGNRRWVWAAVYI